MNLLNLAPLQSSFGGWRTPKANFLPTDIVILGSGVTGLATAALLGDYGLRVLLVEERSEIAPLATTRNHGWAHAGTHQAATIADAPSAVSVARHCAASCAWILSRVPEAVEEPDLPSIAVVRDGSRVEEIEKRWRDAGIRNRRLSTGQLRNLVPQLNAADLAAYLVDDRAVNSRMLCARFAAQVRRNGGWIAPRTNVHFNSKEEAIVITPNERLLVRPRAFIYATGCRTGEVLQRHHGVDLPFRLFKSHLLLTHRLFDPCVFFVDAGEATFIHHGDTTVIGRNGDAVPVEDATYDVVDGDAERLREAAERAVALPRGLDYRSVACLKVDLAQGNASPRSVGVQWGEPIPGHYYLLPGKMTEGPMAAQRLVNHLLGHAFPEIAFRPCDLFVLDGTAASVTRGAARR